MLIMSSLDLSRLRQNRGKFLSVSGVDPRSQRGWDAMGAFQSLPQTRYSIPHKYFYKLEPHKAVAEVSKTGNL